MISSARVASIVLIIAMLSSGTAEAWPRKHRQKVQVRFLADSTLIRGTWGPNEDTYLAELHWPHEETLLVRLVDTYPNEVPPLPHSILASDSETKLYVKRDDLCDLPFSRLILRAAPGDPAAILPGSPSYTPVMSQLLQPETILPCYRVWRR